MVKTQTEPRQEANSLNKLMADLGFPGDGWSLYKDILRGIYRKYLKVTYVLSKATYNRTDPLILQGFSGLEKDKKIWWACVTKLCQ